MSQLVSGALFLCVGVVYDRLHTRDISRYGGLADRMPAYAFVFMVFTSFKDTARYLHRRLSDESSAPWLEAAGRPRIRRIDSGNHPSERPQILSRFAPQANGRPAPVSLRSSTNRACRSR